MAPPAAAENGVGDGATAGGCSGSGEGSPTMPGARGTDALNSSCGCGFLPRLLCPGSTFRSSKYQPSVAYARQAVDCIAQQRAKASLRAAAAHNAMSIELAESVTQAATSVAEAAKGAASVTAAKDRAAAAALLDARKQALLELVAELGRVPTRMMDMEMGIHHDTVDLKDFDDAAIVGQAWDDWAAFFDVWAKVLAATGTVFAYAAGVYNQKKWLAFVAGILGTTALALAGLATYARKLAAEKDAKLQELRNKFSERAKRADAKPKADDSGGSEGGDGGGSDGGSGEGGHGSNGGTDAGGGTGGSSV